MACGSEGICGVTRGGDLARTALLSPCDIPGASFEEPGIELEGCVAAHGCDVTPEGQRRAIREALRGAS